MKNIYFVWGFVIILLLGTITFIGLNLTKKNNEYKTLENEIEESVENYLGEHLNEYPKSASKKIKISYIINNGYNINLNTSDDSCDGYVVVKKENVGYTFKSYIKCHDYETDGYKENM